MADDAVARPNLNHLAETSGLRDGQKMPRYGVLMRIAEAIGCDQRTIKKALRGEYICGKAGIRIRGDLRALGYQVPEPVQK